MNTENFARLLYMTYQGARMGNMDNWDELPEDEKNLWRKQADLIGERIFIGGFKARGA